MDLACVLVADETRGRLRMVSACEIQRRNHAQYVVIGRLAVSARNLEFSSQFLLSKLPHSADRESHLEVGYTSLRPLEVCKHGEVK